MDRRLVLVLALLFTCGASRKEDPSLAWEGPWSITWTRPEWWSPREFTGTLVLTHTADGWHPGLSFQQSGGVLTPSRVAVAGDTARLDFAWSDGGQLRLDLFRDGDLVHGMAQSLDEKGAVRLPWTEVAGYHRVPFVGPLVDASVTTPWSAASPAAVGLDEAVIRQILTDVHGMDYSGFLLVKDDHVIALAGTAPLEVAHVASVSKALSSLAVPFLLAEGKWPSIDEPIADAIGWPLDDPRHAITLRHVLSHTTGLEVPDYKGWFASARGDFRADLQSARLIDPPGSRFKYSNRAAELTSEVVAKAAGQPLDVYLKPRLLDPLGVSAEWGHDPKGHAKVHAGVMINVVDLVKVGVMLRDDGKWQGTQVLPAGWVDTATGQPAIASVPGMGLGWFLDGGGAFSHTGDSGAFLVVDRAKGIVAAGVHRPSGEIGSVFHDVEALSVK